MERKTEANKKEGQRERQRVIFDYDFIDMFRTVMNA
jgi:hypothetical protein